MKKYHIYIVHGYTASSTANWYPSFKDELNNIAKVTVLDMPNPMQPDFNEWVNHLEKNIDKNHNEIILIGHSLGCVTILNYLNYHKINGIKSIFLISGFVEETPIPALSKFIDPPLNYDHLIQKIPNRMAISAIDDDIVPYSYTKKMADKLKAEFTLLNEGKHFIDRDGIVEFPYLINEVKKLIDEA